MATLRQLARDPNLRARDEAAINAELEASAQVFDSTGILVGVPAHDDAEAFTVELATPAPIVEEPDETTEHAVIDAGPIPTNAVTGTAYRGGNIMRLLVAESEHGYGPGGWAGFKQWLTVGRVVRKGEHGTACLTVVTVTTDNGTTTKPRGFKVFHYDQTEALAEDGAS